MGALYGDQPEVVDRTTEDKYLIIEQIVDTVLGGEAFEFRGLVVGASRAYDSATAVSLIHSLLGHLEEHPDDARPLEALVVMGLAHPKALNQADVPLTSEGRRLAGLLEAQGEAERAQDVLEYLAANDPEDRGLDKDLAAIMRRTGNVDRLADRYLRRAEEAVADGRRRDAVTWLREVLMLDRSRRDVARMIRDLQYADREVKESWGRRLRLVALTVLICGLLVGIVYRDLHVQRSYASLPDASEDNLDSLRIRLASIDALIARNPLWLGMFKAGRERASLRGAVDRLESKMAERARIDENVLAERVVLLDAYRTRGLLLVQQGKFSDAREQFQLALEEAPENWEHRTRVEADVEAITAHITAEAEAAAAAEAEAEAAETEATTEEGAPR